MLDKRSIVDSLSVILVDMLIDDYEVIVEKLNEIGINKITNILLSGTENYDSDDLNIIELIIRILQDIYNNSEVDSPVTDEDYDRLYELNRDLQMKEIVGAPINKVKDRKIGYHSYPALRGTLDKVHFIRKKDKGKDIRKSLEEWIKGIENKLGRLLYENEKKAVMTPKWDGISTIFEFKPNNKIANKVLTRGDVSNNEAVDITELFNEIKLDFEIIDSKYYKEVMIGEKYETKIFDNEYAVKTEIVMKISDFERFCKDIKVLKHPRSAVISILNKTRDFDKKHLEYLTIIPLQYQEKNDKFSITITNLNYGFSIINDITNFKEVQLHIDALTKHVNKKDILIDGIVITLNNEKLKEKLGRENSINKFEVAYKLPPEKKKTIIKDIIMSTGILGSITPVAIIKPVKINGNTINNISLGSIDRFEELGIRQGDEVIIKYDVIPYLIIDETCKRNEKGKLFKTPTTCRYCKQLLVKDPVLKCVNESCDSRQIGKIVNYAVKMSIPNISSGIITLLYELSVVKSIKDLYFIKKHKDEILLFKGFGEKLFNKIIDSINSRKTVYNYELLGSLGIPDIGRKIFKRILNIYYLSELKDICLNNDVKKLTKIGGIKNKTANKIIKGVNSNLELIDFLCSELTIKQDLRKYVAKVCFTKIRDREFEKFLDNKNILIVDNYSKDVSLVIVKTLGIKSSKVDKAKKDDISIVTLEEAYKIFKYEKNN